MSPMPDDAAELHDLVHRLAAGMRMLAFAQVVAADVRQLGR